MLHKSALAYFLLQRCKQLKLVATQACRRPIPASFQERAGLHWQVRKFLHWVLAIHTVDLSVELELQWLRLATHQISAKVSLIIIL